MSQQKRTRLSKPKVRTGCKTCKLVKYTHASGQPPWLLKLIYKRVTNSDPELDESNVMKGNPPVLGRLTFFSFLLFDSL
jgi:hypothetical protein